MQITLDGYVAAPNDEADWVIGGDDEWSDLYKDLHSADTYLLGRKMYPIYSEYWQSALHNPDSAPNELKFAKLANITSTSFLQKAISFPTGKIPGWPTIFRLK